MMTDEAVTNESVSRPGGAPAGNRNSVKHGLRMTVGRLPRNCKWITDRVSQFRRMLERAIKERHGSLSVAHSFYVQSASRCEQNSLLAQRWLRLKGDDLTPETFMRFSNEVMRATLERDKYIRSAPDIAPVAEPDGDDDWDLDDDQGKETNQ